MYQEVLSKQQRADPKQKGSVNDKKVIEKEVSGKTNDSLRGVGFESPVLETLATDSVNKGLEIQRIVTNLIGYAVMNLALNFTSFYLWHTRSGQVLREQFTTEYILSILHIPKNPLVYTILKYLSIEYIRHVFSLLVVYNVVSSTLRLVKRVNYRDLKLNENQKKLLGFVGDQRQEQILKKPHSVLKGQDDSATAPPPYLFKALESPMKKKEVPSTSTRNVFTKSVSFEPQARRTSVATTTSVSAPASTTVNGAGYIPSNKYAYMMNTPSPRKF